jgi:hypothetical protein
MLSVSLEIARREIRQPGVRDVSFKNQCGVCVLRLLANIDRRVATPAFISCAEGLAPEERSGTQELTRVHLDRLDGGPQAISLQMTGASSREGPHIRLRYPVPDHLAPMGVGSQAHRLARRIVFQQFNCRGCNGIRILKGDQRSASIVQ